jgi:hypothetical protein
MCQQGALLCIQFCDATLLDDVCVLWVFASCAGLMHALVAEAVLQPEQYW